MKGTTIFSRPSVRRPTFRRQTTHLQGQIRQKVD